MIAISIVSHGHGSMVDRLLLQLRSCPEVTHIVLTYNTSEPDSKVLDERLDIIRNASPKGFGANHNAAYKRCREPFFCVLNPDIILNGNPFTVLLKSLEPYAGALAAPLIMSPSGDIEDSVRHFPTIASLIRKIFGGHDGRYDVQPGQAPFFPDWVGGMFMLFRSPAFAALGGFDEAYYLYYEDVDLCKRAWQKGMKVMACPEVQVIHDARRTSHRNLRHLRWHLASMVRYLFYRR